MKKKRDECYRGHLQNHIDCISTSTRSVARTFIIIIIIIIIISITITIILCLFDSRSSSFCVIKRHMGRVTRKYYHISWLFAKRKGKRD